MAEAKHACPKCVKKYDSGEELDSHSKESHPLICTKCAIDGYKMVFDTKELLMLHDETYHKFVCRSCNIKFSTSTQYDEHIAERHRTLLIEPVFTRSRSLKTLSSPVHNAGSY